MTRRKIIDGWHRWRNNRRRNFEPTDSCMYDFIMALLRDHTIYP